MRPPPVTLHDLRAIKNMAAEWTSPFLNHFLPFSGVLGEKDFGFSCDHCVFGPVSEVEVDHTICVV